MKTRFIILHIVLIFVFICDLYFVYRNQTEQRFFTKTLLLPLLLIIYLTETNFRGFKANLLFASGLIFSFFGDLFLLFEWGFLFGLGSFLLAHMAYIITFKKIKQRKISEIWPILLSVYASALLVFLWPDLDEMKIPVVLYTIFIITMMYNAIKTSQPKLIVGAVLFVISDSVLAVNLFVKSGTFLSLMVMITYVSAQWMLVKGMLSEAQKTDSIHTIQ